MTFTENAPVDVRFCIEMKIFQSKTKILPLKNDALGATRLTCIYNLGAMRCATSRFIAGYYEIHRV